MIQRWKLGKVVGMFKTRDGDWVKYSDHEAIVNELVEALENCLGFVVAHPQFTEDLRNLIAKARGNHYVRRTDAN